MIKEFTGYVFLLLNLRLLSISYSNLFPIMYAKAIQRSNGYHTFCFRYSQLFWTCLMEDQLHIIIASDRGKVFRLPCSRKKIGSIAVISTAILLFLFSTSIFSISLFTRHRSISSQLDELREQLRTSAGLIAEQNRQNEEQQLRLKLKVAKLELSNVRQAAEFKEEKETILSSAVNELAERSELIGRMIDSIGVELPAEHEDDGKNSGGPFIKMKDDGRDELLYQADRYLKTIRFLPFGRPVDGPITSGFGKRKDPVNGQSAFHTGLDFRSNIGAKIYATADGVVKRSFYNGGYGNFILIEHGNGYTSSFSHMQKRMVRAGDKVHRGQLIGLVGNSGRSTGPHLHYEISLDDKPINPYTFMQVASASESDSSSSEKE